MHRAYKDTTLEEIKSFIRIIISMGLNKRPVIPDYWKNDEVYTAIPLITETMSYNRYKDILAALTL